MDTDRISHSVARSFDSLLDRFHAASKFNLIQIASTAGELVTQKGQYATKEWAKLTEMAPRLAEKWNNIDLAYDAHQEFVAWFDGQLLLMLPIGGGLLQLAVNPEEIPLGMLKMLALRNVSEWLQEHGRAQEAPLVPPATLDTAPVQAPEVMPELLDEALASARRTQLALLPDLQLAVQAGLVAQQAVLFEPRDVIGGDFYWQRIDEGCLTFVLADCVGHGIEGAMKAMMGHAQLSAASDNLGREAALASMLQVADQLMHKPKGNGREVSTVGFDLLAVQVRHQQQTVCLAGTGLFALYVLPDGRTEFVRGSHLVQDEGSVRNLRELELPYQSGALLVLFSDGVPDQFGGPNNRKWGQRAIAEFITQHHTAPLAHQKAAFVSRMQSWQGTTPQTDDRTMVWLRLV